MLSVLVPELEKRGGINSRVERNAAWRRKGTQTDCRLKRREAGIMFVNGRAKCSVSYQSALSQRRKVSQLVQKDVSKEKYTTRAVYRVSKTSEIVFELLQDCV